MQANPTVHECLIIFRVVPNLETFSPESTATTIEATVIRAEKNEDGWRYMAVGKNNPWKKRAQASKLSDRDD